MSNGFTFILRTSLCLLLSQPVLALEEFRQPWNGPCGGNINGACVVNIIQPNPVPVQFRVTSQRTTLVSGNMTCGIYNDISAGNMGASPDYLSSTHGWSDVRSSNAVLNISTSGIPVGGKVSASMDFTARYILYVRDYAATGTTGWVEHDSEEFSFTAEGTAESVQSNYTPDVDKPVKQVYLFVGGRHGPRPTDNDLAPIPPKPPEPPNPPCGGATGSGVNSVLLTIPVPDDIFGEAQKPITLVMDSLQPSRIKSSVLNFPLSNKHTGVWADSTKKRFVQYYTANHVFYIDDAGPDDQSFSLWLYPRAAGTVPDSAGLIPVSGDPLKIVKIENPDRTLATTGNLRVTTEVGTHVSTVDYVHRPTVGEWEMITDDGYNHEIVKTESNNLTAALNANPPPRKVQLRTISHLVGTTSHVVSKVRETYQRFECGTKLISQVEDPDGVARTTTWAWGTVGTASDFGRITKINEPGGGWKKYSYDTKGRCVKVVSGLQNQPDTTPEAQCRVVEHVYDPAGAPTWSRLETETIAGQEVSRRFIREYNDGYDDILCVSPGAAWDDAANLVTKVRYYTTGVYKGRLKSKTTPDGLMTLYTHTASPSSATVEANVVETTTVEAHGVPNTAGTAILDGTSTMTVTNRSGHVIQKLVQDITSGIITAQEQVTQVDAEGRPLTTLLLDGRTESKVYDCCHLASETARTGITTTYTHDDANGKRSTARQGLTITRHLLGRETIQSRKGTDNSEFELSRTETNLAGELIKEYSLETGTVTHATVPGSGGGFVTTTTYADGGTRIETRHRDHTLASVTGTATSPVRYESGTETNGQRWVKTIHLDAAGADSQEWEKEWTDMAGRVVKRQKGSAAVATLHYNAKSQLVKTVDPGGVTVLFDYNTKGEQTVSALDMDRDGVIDYDGDDMITRQTRSFVKRGGTRDVFRTLTEVWATLGSAAATEHSTVDLAVDGLDVWHVENGLTRQATTAYGTTAGSWTATTTYEDGSTSVSSYVSGRLDGMVRKDSTGATVESRAWVYDSHGRIDSEVDGRGGVHQMTYRAVANPVSGGLQVTSDQVGTIQSPPVGTATVGPLETYAYDAAGRLNQVTDALGGTVTRTYYPTGQVNAVGGSRSYPVSHTYTAQGRMASMTTATGTTTWDYHPESGLLWHKSYAGSLAYTLTYTAAGRLSSRVSARGITTTYTPDNAGRTGTTDYSDSTPDVTATYTRLGQPHTLVAGGTTRTLSTTAHGEVTAETWAGGPLDGIQVDYAYDALRRRSGLTASSGTSQLHQQGYTYDEVSRLKTVTAGSFSATYRYLATASLLDGIDFKAGTSLVSTTDHDHDLAGHLKWIKHLNAASQVLQSHTYAVNNLGQRTGVQREDGSGKAWGYNDRGEVTSAAHHFADTTPVPLEQYAYTYDGIGNRLTTTEGTREQTWTPNAKNQYVSRTHSPWVKVAGEADADATVTVNDQPATRHQTAFWKELSVSNSAGPVFKGVTVHAAKPGAGPGGTDLIATETRTPFVAGTVESFTHDADGNLTEDDRWTYTWDAENRLTRMTEKAAAPPSAPYAVPARQRLTFTYDPLSRRLSKLVETFDVALSTWNLKHETRFVYDGWNLIAELKSTDPDLLPSSFSLQTSFTWGLDVSGTLEGAGGVGGLLFTSHFTGSGLHAPSLTAATSIVGHDGNGNVTTLLDAITGSITARYDYDAFGNILQENGPRAAANAIRFSGKYTDAETGLLYYGFRSYSPRLGRWLSADPIEELGGLNLYAFLENEGIHKVDVLGMAAQGGHSVTSYSGKTYNSLTPFLFRKDNCGRSWAFHTYAGVWIRLTNSSDPCCEGGSLLFPSGWKPKAPPPTDPSPTPGDLNKDPDKAPELSDLIAEQDARYGKAFAAGHVGLAAGNGIMETLNPAPGGEAVAAWALAKAGSKLVGILKGVLPPAAKTGPKLLGPGTSIGAKIQGQLAGRGWTPDLVQSTVRNPARTVPWRDTRHLPGGGRMNDPATAYYSQRGGYVVRNERTGDIVQVSNRTDSNWIAPWD